MPGGDEDLMIISYDRARARLHFMIFRSCTVYDLLVFCPISRCLSSWKITGKDMVDVTILRLLYSRMKLSQIHLWDFSNKCVCMGFNNQVTVKAN